MRRTCVDAVHQLACRDERVVFIGSDLSPGLLAEMKEQFPLRHYMEGVSEANFVGMAAGMAMEGFIPYINTIATFITRRCYEQVAVDVCMHNLPVRMIANGGGLVYAPLGPTHIAIEDIAIMRVLPNMTIVAPADAEEMRRFMDISLDWPGPIYIRLAKGGDPVVTNPEDCFEIGRGYHLRHANGGWFGPVLFATTGVATTRALSAAEFLEQDGIAANVLHLPTVKPLDDELVLRLAERAPLIVTVEEGTLVGGLGSAVTDLVTNRMSGRVPPIRRLGVPDAFLRDYGTQDSLMESCGLEPEQIWATVKDTVSVLAAA